jgi:hypothetical protein
LTYRRLVPRGLPGGGMWADEPPAPRWKNV